MGSATCCSHRRLHLSDATVVQPDLASSRGPGRDRHGARDRRLSEPRGRDLSASSRATDRTTKATIYARHRVPYYWIVASRERTSRRSPWRREATLPPRASRRRKAVLFRRSRASHSRRHPSSAARRARLLGRRLAGGAAVRVELAQDRELFGPANRWWRRRERPEVDPGLVAHALDGDARVHGVEADRRVRSSKPKILSVVTSRETPPNTRPLRRRASPPLSQPGLVTKSTVSVKRRFSCTVRRSLGQREMMSLAPPEREATSAAPPADGLVFRLPKPSICAPPITPRRGTRAGRAGTRR